MRAAMAESEQPWTGQEPGDDRRVLGGQEEGTTAGGGHPLQVRGVCGKRDAKARYAEGPACAGSTLNLFTQVSSGPTHRLPR